MPGTGLPRLLLDSGASLADHVAAHGPLPSLGRGDGGQLIAEVERAGLRGRGGAAFPTGLKMRAVAEAGRPSAVVVNGGEGEPASEKDALLLATAPHLVLDGAELAAQAVGAGEAIVCIRSGAEQARARIARALEERRRSPVRFRVVATPNAYLAGEESALVNFLNGAPLKPTFVPPRPFERGVGKRPTLVQNVETLAHLALIARHGAHWFRALGSPDEPGSALVTLGGGVLRPGVYEIEPGARLSALLDAAGGSAGEVRAVLMGGCFGSWIDGSRLDDVVLDREHLRPFGAALGAGVIFVLPTQACGVAENARALAYLARESAGQCGPCANGLPAMATAFARIAQGVADPRVEQDVERWSRLVYGRGACHHPNGAARLAVSALDVFANELEQHRRGGPCARCATSWLLPLAHDSRAAA
jgi:NADH:ubiquinone oxidoreductase subunit F (NADH-binding)